VSQVGAQTSGASSALQPYLSLITGVCSAAAPERPEAPTAYTLVSVQLSMPGKPPMIAPPAMKRATGPAKPQSGTAEEEDKRLAEGLNRLSPKVRKQLARAMKRLTRSPNPGKAKATN
jgi:hypothetical protein